MTHTKDEALKLALEALEDLQRQYGIYPNSFWDWSKGRGAITAIKAALAQPTSGDYALGYTEGFNDACKPKPAQPAQEPMAWGNMANWCLDSDRVLITDKTEAEKYHRDVYDLTPLYTTPPAAQQRIDRVRELECVIADLKAECKELRAAQPAHEVLTSASLVEIDGNARRILIDALKPYCTSPAQQRPWVNITDDQIQLIAKQARSKNNAVVLTNKLLRELNK
jgi:hypothetical protein